MNSTLEYFESIGTPIDQEIPDMIPDDLRNKLTREIYKNVSSKKEFDAIISDGGPATQEF